MQSLITVMALGLMKAGCRVFCEAECRCAPFCTIKHRLLAFLFTAWLFPTGVRSACKETMYGKERETGLEPATACLEGRYAQNRRLLVLSPPEKSVHTTIQKGTLKRGRYSWM